MPDVNDSPEPASGDGEDPGEPTRAHPSGSTPDGTEPLGVQGGAKGRKPRSLARRITYWFIGLLALAILAYGGFYGYILYKASHDIRQSTALGSVAKPSGQGMDLLLMGLDSRKDENGNDLPPAVYNALHAGTAADGGNNSNALMYIHVSDDGTRAVAISIPRDDWAAIAHCKTDSALRQFVPSGCMGKIKSAYGWALAAAQQAGKSWAQAKDIARAEEVQTVEQFLHVRISSFVEVTMGAFYEIAQQVGRVEVCVKENTTDSFSGANFKKGHQWLSAKQAVAFVRQRRDLYGRYAFTDLDRSRRQQAFIVSLLTQMKSAGTLLNPITLNNIVNVATSNVVISKGLSPISVAKIATNLSGGNLHFYTLPIVTDTFWPSGHVNVGEVANQVDLPKIRSIVASLLRPPSPTTSTPLPSGKGYTVEAINASGRNQAAPDELAVLKTYGYTAGSVSNATSTTSTSTITYNPADKAAAQTLVKRLGGAITLVADPSANATVLVLTVGTTLASSVLKAAPTAVQTVSAEGGGLNGPGTNQLSDLTGSGIPCVK